MTDAAVTRVLWWAGIVASTLLAAITAIVLTHLGQTGDLDLGTVRWVHSWAADFPWLVDAAKVIEIALHPTALDVVGLCGVLALLMNKHRRAAIWVVLVLAVTRVLAVLVKEITQRHRPSLGDPLQTLGGYSFPSGHAATATAAAGCVIVLATLLIRRRGLRRLVICSAAVVVGLVGADRLILGVHYPSDVTAGVLLGVIVTLFMFLTYDPRPRSIALQTAALPVAFAGPHRRLAVVLNPSKVPDPGQFRAMTTALAEASGYTEVLWWETTHEDTGYQMAHEAALAEAHVVLAVGGDGTARAVCEELAGTGIPVGIAPAGTGNLLARNLGLPLYLRAAVDVALNGQDRAVDMVAVSGDGMDDAVFMVMAGMGFDAAVIGGVNEDFKARIGWAAYFWSGLKASMFPAIRVEISLDDEPFTKHRARAIVIGNVGNLQGGMPLIPDASLDDGNLDVVLLNPRRFLSWLPLAARVLTKSVRSDETITRMRGCRVVVRAGAEAPRELDGDLIPPGRELHAECIQGRLLVRVPRRRVADVRRVRG